MGLLKKTASCVLIARRAQRTHPYASPSSLLAALLDGLFEQFLGRWITRLGHCVASHNVLAVDFNFWKCELLTLPHYSLIKCDYIHISKTLLENFITK